MMTLPMNLLDATEKLESIGQTHLLQNWDNLTDAERHSLLGQVAALDVAHIRALQNTLQRQQETHQWAIPFTAPFDISPSAQGRGRALVASGKCATLVLAGGQGSRLRWLGPKGCFPVSPIKKKSLYQLIAEKIGAASKQIGRPLQLVIMTSKINHRETDFFLKKNAYFGLQPEQVTLFNQELWPLLDFQGNLFLQDPGEIAMGPNGNGSFFRALVHEGIVAQLRQQGIECIQVVSVDNPLADPVDYGLFGEHRHHQFDILLKTTRRQGEENAGCLALRNGKLMVIEYTEIEPQQKKNYEFINVGIYCFSLSFIERVGRERLPLHVAKKAAKKFFNGNSILPDQPNAWKLEEFVFDALPFAEKAGAILAARDESFAPLKNLHGEDSIDTVQAALFALSRKVFKRITGIETAADARFEVDAQFFYPIE